MLNVNERIYHIGYWEGMRKKHAENNRFEVLFEITVLEKIQKIHRYQLRWSPVFSDVEGQSLEFYQKRTPSQVFSFSSPISPQMVTPFLSYFTSAQFIKQFKTTGGFFENTI